MEIMLSHLGVGMAYDTLDGLNIHAQRLHLRHIGVAAAVRREQAAIVPHPFQEVFDVDGAYDGQGAMVKSLFEHFQAVFVAFLCRGSDIIPMTLEPCTAG